ncbi:protein-L-isoaspartate O-methyltransferase [Natronomonas moolapensis 8.8.11]|uniref:Protein-L-isoaspartate O-methyltransferase n=1 Tax=Natronomonas moolapensis (strain DSM 18674 / CECT 7526 / JCM 14361 / 8.8.11) TaxID=268739 RepID=M1XP14_NATM8|nr:protein-L-isoaspartate(D-aspartate) O-methyltransferase [Natronomonas moolapensis]CCQ35701.1 protein-L-isoaspartate O-methyltransferase [Natronomonas moolapensis 8.8.11]
MTEGDSDGGQGNDDRSDGNGADVRNGRADGGRFRAARDRLVDSLADRGRIEHPATIEALRSVPRHEFVPEERRDAAYADRPLPIGSGQTISAPHMVGIMCDRLAPGPGDRILEIGTGCGYHAAVTAELVGSENVYTVEYVPELAAEARRRLERLGYGDVHVRAGDGWRGWPDHAPYDGAYLTCAAPELPEAVAAQVRVGGRIVAPIGGTTQTLVEATRTDEGLERETHGSVRFVPMEGGA